MSQPIYGKTIVAQMELELRDAISSFSHVSTVGIVYVGTNPVIEHFIAMKQRFAEKIGVQLIVYRLPIDIQTQALVQEVRNLSEKHNGFIVQLPLPDSIDTEAVLDAVPLPKDIDMLSVSAREHIAHGHTQVLPAVAGAIRECIERTPIALGGKKIVIIGQGKLVGAPVRAWLRSLHLDPTIIGRDTTDLGSVLQTADVVISGAGSPGLVTASMLKQGVVLFDAGTSEVEGKIEGDIAPDAYQKASYYTPTPGGIGPVTVACLFKNLITLMKQ